MKSRLMSKAAVCAASVMMVSALTAGCGSEAKKDVTEPPKATEETKNDNKDAVNTADVKETAAPADDTAENQDASQLSLKEAYKDLFKIGVACNSWQLADADTLKAICKDYSSITCENEMKPDALLDHNACMESDDGMPVISTEKLEKILTMAEDAGLKMRGHTLVWHSQTPDWLFYKGYNPSKEKADKKTMLKRMESYIKQVITYCQDKHPGLVYAWDVVNEACNDDGTYRSDSPWYEAIGEEYIEKAFEYAKKYADKDTKLFYNDYNCLTPSKRKLIYSIVETLHKKGLIDGVGLQSHYDMEYFAPASLENTLYQFAQLDGLEIQLTELDMHNKDNSAESMQKEADNYKQMFELLAKMDSKGEANITSVTFWGLNDGCTWLTGFKGEDSYPLLYDADNNAKPSYFSVFNAAKAAE